MMVVQIQKPGGMTLATWFTELRSWLDASHCEPMLFSRSGRIMDKILFNVTFENDNHARLFAANFSKYRPSIRRAIGTERPDFFASQSPERPNSDERPAAVAVAPAAAEDR
jgi:hypothetical protein